MKSEKKNKLITQVHTYISLVLAAILFFFYEGNFAKVFFYASLTMNLYLRLLGINFNAFVNPNLTEEESSKYNSLLVILSSLRTGLVAAVFAVFILKFKFNLYALATGFLLFQVILIGGGILLNASHYNRNSR